MKSRHSHNEPIRVAAVGLGWVAMNRHLPTLNRSSDYRVVGVIDRNINHAREVARKGRYAHYASSLDLETTPWLHEVEAVVIGANPMAHFELAAAAMAAGKHVLTEKPFAMTVAEGSAMVERSVSAGVSLGVVHNFQFARSVRHLRRDIESDALGDIRGIDAIVLGNPKRRLPAWYEELPLGLFYDEGPHPLYLCESLSGALTLTDVHFIRSRSGGSTPARLDAWFNTASARYPIKLSFNFDSPVSEWHVAVFGSKRLGIVDIFRDVYLSLPNDSTHDAKRILRTSAVATLQHWRQHITSGVPYLMGRLDYGNDEVFARFASSIRGNTEELAPISALSGLAVLKLQHEIIARTRLIDDR